MILFQKTRLGGNGGGILAFGRKRQADLCESEVGLVYIAGTWTASATCANNVILFIHELLVMAQMGSFSGNSQEE